jgi:DNA repair exonuclease SbcCD ATPase subunit
MMEGEDKQETAGATTTTASADDATAEGLSVAVSFPLLKKCHERASDKWAKGASGRLEDLRALLPPAVAANAAFVQALHKQLEDRVAAEIQESLDERLRDWDLEAKLRQLDAVVASAERERQEGAANSAKAWRPSGHPPHDQAPHDAKALREALADLNDQVKREEQLAEALATQVATLRHGVADNEKDFDAIVAKLK